MIEHIPLPSRKRLLELFEYNPESGYLIRRIGVGGKEAGTRAGSAKNRGYREVRVDSIMYQEHRIIFRICTGIDAGDFEIDHKNRVRDDNRISNLRLASKSQQNTNRGGFNLCTYNKGHFKAQIQDNGRRRGLGYWPTKEIARAVYATAAAKIYGNFAPDLPPNPFGFVNTHWGKCSDGSHKGVTFQKSISKWRAYITVGGKFKHLGVFPTQADAWQARLAAETEFGFA